MSVGDLEQFDEPETTRTSECARRVTPTPETQPDWSTTSTKGIGKPWQGLFLHPPFGLMEGVGATSQNHGCEATATLAHCQERAKGGTPSAAECDNGPNTSLKVAGAQWGTPHQPPSPPGKLQSRSTFEATAIGVASSRFGTCFFGKHRRSDVPSPRIEGDTSFTLSALNGSTPRARVKVHAWCSSSQHGAPCT